MSIKLSAKSRDTVNRLQRALRLHERPPLLRLALAVAIRDCSGKLPDIDDSKGVEIPMKVILTQDDPLYDSLLLEEFPSVEAPIDPSDRRRMCKCLVDRGLAILWQEFETSGKASGFFSRLVKDSLPRS